LAEDLIVTRNSCDTFPILGSLPKGKQGNITECVPINYHKK